MCSLVSCTSFAPSFYRSLCVLAMPSFVFVLHSVLLSWFRCSCVAAFLPYVVRALFFRSFRFVSFHVVRLVSVRSGSRVVSGRLVFLSFLFVLINPKASPVPPALQREQGEEKMKSQRE